MVRVLIVEDSPTVRAFLVEVLGRAEGITVAGTARDGEEAIEAVQRLKPDVVTMDIVMPRMDGLEATRRLMEIHPLPIVIVSANVPTEEAEASFQALKAGALAVVPRPTTFSDPLNAAGTKQLIRMVKLMAEVKVIRRWPRRTAATQLPTTPPVTVPEPAARFSPLAVAIGGSTGAPVVIEAILSRLPRNYSVPILIVQHIAPGFVDGFSQWLNRSTGLRTQLAQHGELLQPAHVYVAPEARQMGVNREGQITLNDAPPENGHRPAVSFLFRSVAESLGNRSAGVLLSGMGSDGAEGLLAMRQRGALTMAQDRESSVVYSMPAEAVRLGAATHSLTPEGISIMLSLFHCASAEPANNLSSER